MNMLQRGRLLEWLKVDAPDDETGAPQAWILSNAKCLSEGVDARSIKELTASVAEVGVPVP